MDEIWLKNLVNHNRLQIDALTTVLEKHFPEVYADYKKVLSEYIADDKEAEGFIQELFERSAQEHPEKNHDSQGE